MDFNLKKFWIKTTDINGLPAKFVAFEFKEVNPQGTNNFVPRNEFDEWRKNTTRNFNRLSLYVQQLLNSGQMTQDQFNQLSPADFAAVMGNGFGDGQRQRRCRHLAITKWACTGL